MPSIVAVLTAVTIWAGILPAASAENPAANLRPSTLIVRMHEQRIASVDRNGFQADVFGLCWGEHHPRHSSPTWRSQFLGPFLFESRKKPPVARTLWTPPLSRSSEAPAGAAARKVDFQSGRGNREFCFNA